MVFGLFFYCVTVKTIYSTSVISNFSVIPIRWLLTVASEIASFLFRSLAENLLVFSSNSWDSRKINCLLVSGEFDSRFRWKNRDHTHPFVIHAISRFFR